MPLTYHVPFHTRLLRSILRPVFRAIFLILSPVRISGIENVPPEGAYLIAINHVSLYEAPFILAFWPVAPEAAGAIEIWDRPVQSLLVRLYGGIPVHRGEYDRQLLDIILAVLSSGRPLLIAPEGGRSHLPGLRRGKPGAAYIVDLARVPVIPVGITGTTDDYLARALHMQRPVLEMRIGRPVWLPEIKAKGRVKRDARQRNIDLLMMKIAELLPEPYRGVYGDEPFPTTETA